MGLAKLLFEIGSTHVFCMKDCTYWQCLIKIFFKLCFKACYLLLTKFGKFD